MRIKTTHDWEKEATAEEYWSNVAKSIRLNREGREVLLKIKNILLEINFNLAGGDYAERYEKEILPLIKKIT